MPDSSARTAKRFNWKEFRAHARKKFRHLRNTVVPFPLKGDLVAALDARYITILNERFLHDRRTLEALVARLGAREVMVEVGSLAGFSTKLFTRHFARVYSVDPYSPGYDDANDMNSESFRLYLARDLFTIRFLDEPTVVQYREPSAAASRRFDDGSLDFVYLDGSHTQDDVAGDIRSWRPKIKPGGYLAGDDFGWEGVERAVRRHLSDFEIVAGRWLCRIP